jgi:L-threonylcarbamoyladenylate synthase
MRPCYYVRVQAGQFLMKVPLTDEVEKAVDILRSGGVIAMPTDTLYALTASASDAQAVRRVYEVKVREQGKPLPLFVAGVAMAEQAGELNELARRLAARFWPGQLTLVVPKRKEFESQALAGSETVALRQPDNAIAQAVVEALGTPVTGTSANLSGGNDPVSADEVRRQIGDRVDFILDTGPCPVGVSSTLVDCTADEPVILREGAISKESIADALARR